MNLPSKRAAPFILSLLILSAAPPLAAKNAPPFKTIVIKHFVNANGVDLSQNFIGLFCGVIRQNLGKSRIAGQVVDEGAVVPEADAADSLLLEGRFTDFKQGNSLMHGKLTLEVSVYRISDRALAKTVTAKTSFTVSPFTDKERSMAQNTGALIAYQIKHALKTVNLSSIPPLPPGANPAAPASASAPFSAASQAGPKLLTSIQFTSDPSGADITIDGNYAGNTPSLIKLKPGTHSIKITRSGCAPWLRSIEIVAGESRTIAADLETAK